MSLKTMPGMGGGGPGQGWGGGGCWFHQGAPSSPTLQAHDAADDHDVPPAAALHVGQDLLDQADEAEEVGVHEALHGCQALALQGASHAHPSVADCGHGASVGCPPCRGLLHPVLKVPSAQRVPSMGCPGCGGSLGHGVAPAQRVTGAGCRWCVVSGGPWCTRCPQHRGSLAWRVPGVWGQGVPGTWGGPSTEGPWCRMSLAWRVPGAWDQGVPGA